MIVHYTDPGTERTVFIEFLKDDEGFRYRLMVAEGASFSEPYPSYPDALIAAAEEAHGYCLRALH